MLTYSLSESTLFFPGGTSLPLVVKTSDEMYGTDKMGVPA